ncbi:MAG: hypothetical protein VKK97_06490 [Synechococcaceae cyanobacterium]|nr:hypothetical protein [Synechococcaceae cyanobacterium]
MITFDGGALSGTRYSISGPGNFWTGIYRAMSVTGSPPIRTALRPINGDFVIPALYVEGTPITASGLITGQSLATLGLSATSGLLGTWTIGSDSIEVWAGAKPASAPVPGPLPLMGAGTAFAFSRRLRSRLRAGRPTLTA